MQKLITQNTLVKGDHVMKSDVLSYYASIDHSLLFDQLSKHIDDTYVLRLLWGYLKRSVCYGGLYRDVTCGISLGCSLSPLMGAFYLKPLDDAMAESGLFYARYMDDWIVIAPTRWKLRKAVRVVNQVLADLRVEQHPDKTFIGRAERGFDFLGYRFVPEGLKVAEKTVERFIEHACGRGAETGRTPRLFPVLAVCSALVLLGYSWWSWLVYGIFHTYLSFCLLHTLLSYLLTSVYWAIYC